MKSKKYLYFSLISMSLCLLISTEIYAADVEAGRVVSTQCAICHGPEGKGNGAPKSCIACLDANTIIKHINEYKNGVRKNVMMERFVANLTEQDIEDVAAYYASM